MLLGSYIHKNIYDVNDNKIYNVLKYHTFLTKYSTSNLSFTFQMKSPFNFKNLIETSYNWNWNQISYFNTSKKKYLLSDKWIKSVVNYKTFMADSDFKKNIFVFGNFWKQVFLGKNIRHCRLWNVIFDKKNECLYNVWNTIYHFNLQYTV